MRVPFGNGFYDLTVGESGNLRIVNAKMSSDGYRLSRAWERVNGHRLMAAFSFGTKAGGSEIVVFIDASHVCIYRHERRRCSDIT